MVVFSAGGSGDPCILAKGLTLFPVGIPLLSSPFSVSAHSGVDMLSVFRRETAPSAGALSKDFSAIPTVLLG
jgi:hypothetical protein